MAVLFSPIAFVFLSMAVLFSPIAFVFLSMAVLFAAILSVLSVTFFLNTSAKPTVTVGAASVPSTVTVVSSFVPRNWMFGADVLLRVKFFLAVVSAPLIEKFAEILVTAVSPLLILVTTSPVMWLANFALSTPYLMVEPILSTVRPCSSFSTSKVATLLSLSIF